MAMTVKELLGRTKELFEFMAVSKTEEERQMYRNEVIELNIRLVPHILKKYSPYTDDTYQNGCIGLLKAAEEYDASKKVPFVNFACLCIEREIQVGWKTQNRKFENRMGGFLSSLDDRNGLANGDEVDKYEMIADPAAQIDFDTIFEEQGLDDLFYDIIIPAIEDYGTRSKTLDIEKWKELEIKYILEMSQEGSQRRRMTFTYMANELGTVTQNIRTRHKKVIESIKTRCIAKGINLE